MGATNQMQVTQPMLDSDTHIDDLLADLELDAIEGIGGGDIIMDHMTPITADPIIHEPDVIMAIDEGSADLGSEAFGYVTETAPTVTEDASVVKPAKKAKAVKAAKLPKAPKEPKVAAEPKAPVVRKHYANKVDRLQDKLGDTLGDNIVLELSDATLTGADLQKKQAETLATIMSSGKKVQNRQTFIIEYVSGKSAKLNNVITTALQTLKTQGSISMGVEDHFHKTLLAKPYSVNAAKAMGNNSILAMKTLKMIKEEGGKLVANPNSLIMAKLTAMGTF